MNRWRGRGSGDRSFGRDRGGHSEGAVSVRHEGDGLCQGLRKNTGERSCIVYARHAREAYQSVKERNVDDGHIINLNSMSGHCVVPSTDLHFYSSTKFAATALTEGLRQELREDNTHIRATAMEAIDVANAVTYVLSAPPHVQIGVVQMRPVEQVS
ncbi:hypothetical protein ABVT39_026242 [Epinephelus coioides]